jgi:hypothetical protein
LGGYGVWTQDFMLLRQVLSCLSHEHSPFSFVYFWDRVSPFAQAILDYSPPICTSHCSWNVNHMVSCSAFYAEIGSCKLLCLRCPGTTILISAFCVAGITSSCRWVQIMVEVGSCELFAQTDLEPWSSQLAKITGISYWHLAHILYFERQLPCCVKCLCYSPNVMSPSCLPSWNCKGMQF